MHNPGENTDLASCLCSQIHQTNGNSSELSPCLYYPFCCCCCCCCVASVVSNSVRPHRRQPTRLLCPWDSPGKNTGMGCHFLLQCMKVKSESESELTQSCPTLCDPMDCCPSGSSVHRIFQARVEWVAIAFSCHMLSTSQMVKPGDCSELE